MRKNYVMYIVAIWLRQFWQLFCVATMSSLAQLQVQLRSRGKVDVTTRGWLRMKTPEASSYSWCLQSCTNQQRMASRRAFAWIGTLKAQLFFRYEISDLFSLVYILKAWHLRRPQLSIYTSLLLSTWCAGSVCVCVCMWQMMGMSASACQLSSCVVQSEIHA